MKNESEFFDNKKINRFEDKNKGRNFISEEARDQSRLKKVFKKKKDQLRAEEIWQDWEDNDEVY